MDREADYLLIPVEYAAWLGGLHWSHAGDAIEDESGLTFALAPQVALFLEGFGGHAPHFAHVLHLLHLLGVGGKHSTREAAPLAQSFLILGRPLRNAGAFCAHLCRDLPQPRPTDMKQVCGLLWNSTLMAEVATRWSLRTTFHLQTSVEEAPLPPTSFERFVRIQLDGLPASVLVHWLQHGGPPEDAAAATLAEAIPPAKPRTLGQILNELSQRERLGGALPYVAQMVSALSLPPRRRDHSELPIGGYADVTSRGHPEQLLPSQFAVEDLEFVRRFAQNELLYFRREEPTSQIREELLLLLDQGVRAWGTVRLLLTAGALAFGRLAQRRKLPLLLAGTSNGGVPVKLLDVNITDLRHLVDASDLSLNPGLALERALEEPAGGLRDIVLLTHPRALREEEVLAAARRADAETRIFALAVTDRGQVQLSELRRGVPVLLSQFAVDLSAKPVPAPVETGVHGPLSPDTWSGDVERIGFPFRFGIVGPIEKFAFDHEGKHLLTVSQHGLLHLWALDGSMMEVLPRPGAANVPPRRVVALLGVVNGFVVVYQDYQEPRRYRLAYYDLGKRTCAPLMEFESVMPGEWHYRPWHHAVVLRQHTGFCRGIDLASGVTFEPSDVRRPENERVRKACEATGRIHPVRPWVSVANDTKANSTGERVHVHFSTATGKLDVGGLRWSSFAPEADGLPLLQKYLLLTAQHARDTLAATFRTPQGSTFLCVFKKDGSPLGSFGPSNAAQEYLLSADGRYLARQSAPNQVVVHEVTRSPAPFFVTAKGRCHQDLHVEQGHHKMVVQIGNWVHLVRWDRGALELVQEQGDRQEFLRKYLGGVEPRFAGKAIKLSPMAYDIARFRYAVRGEVDVLVDLYGQISLLDRSGALVAMFFVFRNHIGAWLPDGTRHGPASVIGGPSTQDALAAIGKALRDACARGREVNG